MPISDWASACAAARFGHNWTGYGANTFDQSGMRRLELTSPVQLFQAPLVGSREAEEPGFDAGMFYLKDNPETQRLYAERIFVLEHPGGSRQVQYLELDPRCLRGDVPPADWNSGFPQESGFYVTPFIVDRGPLYPNAFGTVGCWLEIKTGTWYVWHYAPWAWRGRAPHVIAAIAMQAGVQLADIDTDSFDDAYDAYDPASGDIPWLNLAREMEIRCWRRVGQTVADLMLEVARHTRDYLGFDLRGRLRLASKTRPTQMAASELAGILRPVRWRLTRDHLYNSFSASYGHVWRSWGNPSNYGDQYDTYGAAEEPNQQGERAGKWTRRGSYAGSIAKYGDHPLPGSDALLSFGGQPVKVQRSHLPFLYDDGDANLPTFNGWMQTFAGGLREVTLAQDLRGLKFQPGDQITGLALTSDGGSFNARCLEKAIDWRSLHVTSTLLEEGEAVDYSDPPGSGTIIWVATNAAADDANDGTSYPSQAVRTLGRALALAAKGDTIAFVNDGSYLLSQQYVALTGDGNALVGTSWDDPGLIIKGVDSTGADALVTMNADSNANGGSFFQLNRGASDADCAKYWIVRNFLFNLVPRSGAMNVIRCYGTWAGPVKIRACSCLGQTIGGAYPSGTRTLLSIQRGAVQVANVVEWCYIQNAVALQADLAYGHQLVSRCVLWHDNGSYDMRIAYQANAVESQQGTLTIDHCTYYGYAAGWGWALQWEDDATNDANWLSFTNNLVYANSTDLTSPPVGETLMCTAGSTTIGGTCGNNWFGFAVAYDAPSTWNGPIYSGSLAALTEGGGAANDDVMATDLCELEVAVADVFEDPATAYDWETPLGITLAIRDLRPLKGATLADDYGQVGAL